MKGLRRGAAGALVACVVAMAIPAVGEMKLPNIIGSNMVLQADAPLPIWGWASAGEKVTVSVAGQVKTATAGADGRWKVVLDKLRANDKPQKMTVKGANEIVLENVLVGEVWGQGEFPFLFVQLAPWSGYKDGELPKIWQAQVESLKIPNTGMAVITDVTGDVNNIHPMDKQSVGTRLALWALARTYGRKDVVCSGPLYKSMKVEGDKAILSFEYAVGLKSRDGQELTEFQVAGADKKFVPAKAVIQGARVVVTALAQIFHTARVKSMV